MTLVVLAAGLGTRYGGSKQLDGVGPGGATLMDYSVFDAARAGFTGVVFVVRPDMDRVIAPLLSRYRALRATAVHQLPDPARAKPWGTAHAVLAARSAVSGPFAVVNADDFYGAAAFRAARQAMGRAEWALVGYRFGDTLPPGGGVSRAVCEVDRAGRLTGITESRNVTRASLPADALVSMNMWTFTPSLFDALERGFAAFRARAGPADEYLLPDAVDELVKHGAKVRVLDARSTWLGLTHQEDREHVSARLRELVAAGAYPERLWPA